MSTTTVPFQTPPHSLARASLAAVAGGVAVLILFVLPAEYGIDPTGVGKALGLTAMSGDVEDTAPDTPAPTPAAGAAMPVVEQSQATIEKRTPWRTDEQTLTIQPHEGIELKAEMKAGDALMFQWTATGPLKMDMHGETSVNAETFTTFWKQKGLKSAQGNFTAPFTGVHGWYWRNQQETPITLTVKTNGFYARLFRPKAG